MPIGFSVRPLEPGDVRRVARPTTGGGSDTAIVRYDYPRVRAVGEAGGGGHGDADCGPVRCVLVEGAVPSCTVDAQVCACISWTCRWVLALD